MPKSVLAQAGTSSYLNNSTTTGNKYTAISFVWPYTATALVSKVSVWLQRVGSPTFTFNVQLRASSGGQPSASVLKVLATGVNASALAADAFTRYDFSCASGVALTNGARYWIVFEANSLGSVSNCFRVETDTFSVGVEIGATSTAGGGTWATFPGMQGHCEVFGYYMDAWPALLFQSWPRYTDEQIASGLEVFEPATGPPRTVRKTGATPHIYTLPGKRISAAGYTVLEAFYETTLFGGTQPFVWTNPWPSAGNLALKFQDRPRYDGWTNAIPIPASVGQSGGATTQRTCVVRLSFLYRPWYPAS